MLRKLFITGIAALGLILVATPESQAQRGGRGGGGRGGVVRSSARPAVVQRSVAPARVSAIRPAGGVIGGAGRIGAGIGANRGFGYGGYGRGYGHGGYGGYGGYGFFGFNPGLGYWGWPSYYPYANDYYGAYPPVGYDSGVVMPPAAYYGGGDVGGAGPVPQLPDVAAHVDVIVPDPDATVWFNGVQTSSRGTTRHFDSPPLQPGGSYSYTVRATWIQGGQTRSSERVIQVSPGARVVVDFTQTPIDVPIGR